MDVEEVFDNGRKVKLQDRVKVIMRSAGSRGMQLTTCSELRSVGLTTGSESRGTFSRRLRTAIVITHAQAPTRSSSSSSRGHLGGSARARTDHVQSESRSAFGRQFCSSTAHVCRSGACCCDQGAGCPCAVPSREEM